MTISVEFTFHGRIDCRSFAAFAQHRASRLDLGLQMGFCTNRQANTVVTGKEALIDMFEMACSLGPYDCIILEVTRTSRGLEAVGDDNR